MHLLLTTCCLAACLGEAEGNTQEVQIAQDELKTAMTNRRVVVTRGETLVVKLETRSTGYVWELKSRDEKALMLQGDPSIETTDNRPGGKEYKVYHFAVVASGSATFTLARPFGNQGNKELRVQVELK